MIDSIMVYEEGAPLQLIAACAFKGMERQWEKDWVDRYQGILKKAEEVVYIGDHPGRSAFFECNEWMVDHSSRLIAVFTGAPGGTKETIRYARSKNREKNADFYRKVIVMGER